MKLSPELNSILNAQIMHEFKNANIYKQIQSYFEDMQLKNLAEYFKNQSQDEFNHATKFIDYINDRTGGKVTIGEVDAPKFAFMSVESVADAYMQTEELTTEKIEEIMDVVLTSKSYMDMGFVQEMLDEQVKEEDEALEFATKIKMVSDLVLFDATFGE